MNTIKKHLKSFILSLAVLAATIIPAHSADWNDLYGMGNIGDDWSFTGSGVPFTCVSATQSNCVYYVCSARATGIPKLTCWVKGDLVAGTLKWYTATSSVPITAAGMAGTNYFTASTNGMVAKDLLLLRCMANGQDSYQLLTHLTNATGGAGFAVSQTTSNAISIGDRIYKLVPVASLTPLAMTSITNQVIDPMTEWMPMGVNGKFIEFNGRLGWPSVLVNTYSNAGALFVTGDYTTRPRR